MCWSAQWNVAAPFSSVDLLRWYGWDKVAGQPWTLGSQSGSPPVQDFLFIKWGDSVSDKTISIGAMDGILKFQWFQGP